MCRQTRKSSALRSVAVLDRPESVVPIAYQEGKNSAVVTVPSLEVFETGTRFFIYIKGSFDQAQALPVGHISTVVRPEDDLGNQYDLRMRAGSISS